MSPGPAVSRPHLRSRWWLLLCLGALGCGDGVLTALPGAPRDALGPDGSDSALDALSPLDADDADEGHADGGAPDDGLDGAVAPDATDEDGAPDPDAALDDAGSPVDAGLAPDVRPPDDTGIEPPDGAMVEPPDAAMVEPPDAAMVEPPDAAVEPPDAAVEPPDAAPAPGPCPAYEPPVVLGNVRAPAVVEASGTA